MYVYRVIGADCKDFSDTLLANPELLVPCLKISYSTFEEVKITSTYQNGDFHAVVSFKDALGNIQEHSFKAVQTLVYTEPDHL